MNYLSTFIVDNNNSLLPANFMDGNFDLTIEISSYCNFTFNWESRENDNVYLEAIHGYYGLEMATSFNFQCLTDDMFIKLLLSDDNDNLNHFKTFCRELAVYLARLEETYDNSDDDTLDFYNNWLDWANENDFIEDFIKQYA